MAQKKCPDCAELVQADARVCRYCRHQFAVASPNVSPERPRSDPKKQLLIVLSIIAGLMAVAVLADLNRRDRAVDAPAPSSEEAVRDEPSNEDKAGVLAERQLRDALKDPDSMDIRNSKVPNGAAYLCGEVNANNSFGGKTGYRRFIAGAISGMPVIIDDGSLMNTSEFQKAWQRMC